MTKAQRIRDAVARHGTLLMPGVYDALSARIAVGAGFEVIFISGYSVAASRLGLPDFGFLTATEVVEAARGVCENAGQVPVIVDADTGYGNALNVQRTVRDLIGAGAAGVFLEDQVWPKRCGHMRGKQVIPLAEQVLKLRAARDAAGADDLFIVARTDARAPLGLDAAIERAQAYREAGADATFVEAPQSSAELEEIGRRTPGPRLANMLEKGLTPLMTPTELGAIGFQLVVHPLTALYGAARAMADLYRVLKDKGTTRDDLARLLPWEEFHEVIDLDRFYALDAKYTPKS